MAGGNGTGGDKLARTIDGWSGFSPSKWEDGAAPRVPWLIKGCFVKGTVGMISSDGGLGKSLLAQQLITCGAVGMPWLGYEVPPIRTYGVFTEDDEGALQRRQDDINRHYGISTKDLDDAWMVERVAKDNIMFAFDRASWSIKPTPIWDQFVNDVVDFGAQIVVLDHVREVFGGNEIDAQQIGQFTRNLRWLARKVGGVVILLAHVSNEGLKEGSGLAGNRAWNNSIRARFFLTEKKQAESEEGTVNNFRYLRTMKNNEGPRGGRIPLVWEDGVFKRIDDPQQPVAQTEEAGAARKTLCETMLMEAVQFLSTTGQRLSPEKISRTYIVSIAAKDARLAKFSRAEIEAAKDRLLHKKRLEIVAMSLDRGKPREYIRPTGVKYAAEVEAERQQPSLGGPTGL